MPINNLIDQLRRDEGESLKVYRDTKGILTAGVGHNLAAHEQENLMEGDSITQAQSDEWLKDDINDSYLALIHCVPWSTELDEIRKSVLINMVFNMGAIKLLGFHHMLGFMQTKTYDLAAKAMLDSMWVLEVGNRAKRLSVQLESGIWQ